MKKNIINFLFSASVLMLTCAFTPAPLSPGERTTEDTLSAIPFGGAHLMFAGKNGGQITKKEIEGQSELKVDGCAAGARILKYSLHITKSGKTTTLSAETNYLNKEMLASLKGLSSGDSFEFKQVKARLMDSQDVVDVTSSKFVIVDKKV